MNDYIDGLVQRGLISPDVAMTHWPDQSAQPYMHPNVPAAANALAGFASGGLQGAGVPLPDWASNNSIQKALQNPDNDAALGVLSLVPIKLQPLNRTKETEHLFQIANDKGDTVGHAFLRYVPRDKAVRVDNIFSTSNDPNTLGTKEIRSLLPEIKRHFPDAEEVGGMRISGVRSETGNQGNARMRLPGAPGGPIKPSQKLDIKAVLDYLNSLSNKER